MFTVLPTFRSHPAALRGARTLAATFATVLLAVPAVGRAQAAAGRAARPAAVVADTAVLAGGCFWGVEGVFEHVAGVLSVTSGFATGAPRADAMPVSYERVSSGRTPYAEAVRVVYDPRRVSYAQLLQLFFTVAHDPTEVDRQGPDVGPQYRSAVFTRDDAQRQAATAAIARLTAAHTYPRPIATRVEPLAGFHEAEAYHQNYMALHPDAPYIVVNDAPKLVRLKREYPAMYREPAATR